MGYFEDLNKAWQEAILDEISDSDGGTRPEIAEAFREHYGKYLSEVEIADTPDQADRDEIGSTYTEFRNGWDAAMKVLAKDNEKLISSWVRAHGEYTDYSDLGDNEYPAYIVKESDLHGEDASHRD